VLDLKLRFLDFTSDIRLQPTANERLLSISFKSSNNDFDGILRDKSI
jgi:hypothetical protein